MEDDDGLVRALVLLESLTYDDDDTQMRVPICASDPPPLRVWFERIIVDGTCSRRGLWRGIELMIIWGT